MPVEGTFLASKCLIFGGTENDILIINIKGQILYAHWKENDGLEIDLQALGLIFLIELDTLEVSVEEMN